MKFQLQAFIILIVFLVGCTQSPANSVSRVSIKSVYSTINPDVLPAWVAKDAGIFDRNGLDVDLMYIEGGVKATQALLSKDAAFGVFAPSSPINANAAGADLVVIASIVSTLPYNIVVIPEVKSGADLKGKRFAVSSLSGASYAAMRLALRDIYHLDPDKDVTPVIIGTDATRENALTLKQVDAAMLHIAGEDMAKRDGLVILEPMWNKGIDYQFTSIVVSKAYMKDNLDVASRYVKSLIQAIGYIKDPVNKAAVIKSLSKGLKQEDTVTLESGYKFMSETFLKCAAYVSLNGIKPVIADSKEAVTKGITPEQMVDNSIVKALDDSGFIKANCK